MPRTELEITSFDPESLKQSFIEFLQSKGEFDDFNYEGSAINTIIDLLVRDTTYNAYLANFLVNESFMDSSQLRSSVVSHASKLSYIPRSSTATRIICDITVTPASTDNLDPSITMEPGAVFLANDGTNTFTFVSNDSYVLPLSVSQGIYIGRDIELIQGQRVTNRFFHNTNGKVEIPNRNCDTSTLTVRSTENGGGPSRMYRLPDGIGQLDNTQLNFFLSENHRQLYEVEFGKDILGEEPPDGSLLELSYVSTEEQHANGIQSVTAATGIEDFTNISVDVTTRGYGGAPREDIETTRFVAPKHYQAQDRALTDSDYIPILKANFPFIRSAISWGGEKNQPPAYGSVFISIISTEGELVTQAVKQQMVSFLQDKNVGSITPRFVDPETFGIDLTVEFAWNKKKTNRTFNELSSSVVDICNEYGNQLNDFDQYYNNSLLTKHIQREFGIESTHIEKRMYRDVPVLRFNNPIYMIDFGNPIVPESISSNNFELDINGENHLIYDDGEGNVFASYEISGQKTVLNIGTVDYETGKVEFVLNMIQSNDVFRLYMEPDESNIYVERNKVIRINEINTKEMQIRRRTI